MHQLDPALAAWLEEYNRELADLVAKGYKATAIGAREALANLTRQMVTPGPDIAWVNDELVAGRDYTVPVRIYHPDPKRPLPVLVFFHGGGHMVGSVSVYDPICRRLAAASRHVVVSAEYRRSPESPYQLACRMPPPWPRACGRRWTRDNCLYCASCRWPGTPPAAR